MRCGLLARPPASSSFSADGKCPRRSRRRALTCTPLYRPSRLGHCLLPCPHNKVRRSDPTNVSHPNQDHAAAPSLTTWPSQVPEPVCSRRRRDRRIGHLLAAELQYGEWGHQATDEGTLTAAAVPAASGGPRPAGHVAASGTLSPFAVSPSRRTGRSSPRDRTRNHSALWEADTGARSFSVITGHCLGEWSPLPSRPSAQNACCSASWDKTGASLGRGQPGKACPHLRRSRTGCTQRCLFAGR